MKKGLIAVFLSIALPILCAIFFSFVLGRTADPGVGLLIGFVLVVVYWCYKFFKNEEDIETIDSKAADQLLKWNELLEKGAITQEEFDKAKRDLLG